MPLDLTAARHHLDLAFARQSGGRSELVSRHVRYPWSLTQPFYDDSDGTACVIPQSASGGLFAREQVSQRIVVGAEASVLLRTQGATLVHRRAGRGAQSDWRVEIGPDGRAELLQDPIVLGPGAELAQSWDICLETGARALLLDGWTWLRNEDGPGFALLRSETRIRRANGCGSALDRTELSPALLAAQEAGAGRPVRALAMAVIARGTAVDGQDDLEDSLRDAVEGVRGTWTGIGTLPCGLGWVLRAVCTSAGDLAPWSTAVWHAVRRFDVGSLPGRVRRGL